MSENSGAKANVTITVRDRQGRFVSREKIHNLVVTSGKNLIRDFLYGDSVAILSHFAVGTGSSIPQLTDMALEAEVFRDAVTSKSKTAGKITYTYFLSTENANGQSLNEAGLFNANFAGTMYARTTYSTILKSNSVSVTFTWELTWT